MASRLGHKSSGITAKAQGWKSGMEVQGRHTSDGRDVFECYATRGSATGGGNPQPVARVTTVDTTTVVEVWDGNEWVTLHGHIE